MGCGMPGNIREKMRALNERRAEAFFSSLTDRMEDFLTDACGSPIEQLLGAHIPSIFYGDEFFLENSFWPFGTSGQEISEHLLEFERKRASRGALADPFFLATTQVKVDSYRVDFAISASGGVNCGLESGAPISGGYYEKTCHYFIECDGHDFHEKTKEQVARDKKRDRKIQLTGIPILRFSGSEIFKRPKACINEINSHLTKSLWGADFVVFGDEDDDDE